ncbi:glycosyltransferase [Halopseudomonas xiamenensis]|uniref:glycosyltransferase n=1 Tax=Halopseudomonas xiamenensis TaxID=157792 RepID=UPI001627F148|nr:glycosyltransferase [Halopseudomonas xiamenensis]
MAEILFWLCLLLPLYAYVGYPLCLALLSLGKPLLPNTTAPPLSISIIVAAHNEAQHIVQKIHSLLGQDYKATALEIIIASDGSTDDTVTLAQSLQHPAIRVLDLPRLGKTGALNHATSLASNDILVFTDADNRWSSDTLGRLLAPLADQQVGACGGHMVIANPGKGLSFGDSLYRHYEAWLRDLENRTGCMVSADGALLALRRELFQEIPPQVNDDFFISTCAPAVGQRIIYVPEATVQDEGVDQPDRQFRRRQRVTVGGLHSLAARSQLMNPLRHGSYAFALISHKLLRRLAPLALVPLLISNLFLWQAGNLYQLMLIAQLLGYAAAVIGLLDRNGRLPRPFRLAGFVLITLAGMASGVWLFLRGHRYTLWNPQQNR